MKKFSLLGFFIVFLLAFPNVGEASSGDAKIFLDGEQLNLASGVKVANVNNNIMIPIRVVSENLGFKVKWDKASQSVTVKNSDTTVKMVIGSKSAEIDGQQASMNIAPMLSKHTTLVPLRFVSSEMGMNVRWDNEMKAVFLSSGENEPPSRSGQDGGATPSKPGDKAPGKSTGSAVSPKPEILATVDGISFSENQLMISTSSRVTPKVFQLKGPDRIVVDLPNTAFSNIFGTEHMINAQNSGELVVTEHPEVSQIRYSLFSDSPSTVRVVIQLTAPVNYTVSTDNSGLIFIDLGAADSVPVPQIDSGNKVVVIDAGHGGSAPGKVSVTGKYEKDFNLSLAQKVEALLQKEEDIDVVMTRTDDSTISLSERSELANRLNSNIFVSIHGNGHGTSSPNGTETLYTRDASLELANTIHKHLIKATGLKDRRVKKQNLHVTRETNMPAVLLEIGFLSNKGDEAQMFDEEFQNRVAEAIVNGIKEYLKV